MQHQQIVIRKKDRRHLGDSLSNVEGRRLRSAFDVFDFVNNAVSSGVNKAKKDPAKKIENIDKAIGVYAKLSEKYPTLKTFAKLQEGNTAFQNELDDKAIAAYTEVINELEAKQCDEDELSYLKTSYQYMGFIYTYDKQDFNTAKPYWDKLLKLDPQNKLANDAYEKAGLKPGE